ncbi:uncharacterized protein [Phyllobates terribilis]|uniref:uncharacterized protein n=1 Tax=Phyllobates terribilis TaxID=111132 RepID=UPI003CCA7B93
MRRNLEEQGGNTKLLITYGCSAHLLHLLAKDLSVPEIKANVVEIAKYFRNNHFAAAALKRMGGTKLTLPQNVRWNSVVDCFEQYIKNWPILMTLKKMKIKIDGTVTAKILNIGLKRNVEHMLSFLKPISQALNKIQKNSCFIADAVEIWKELSEHLKTELHMDRIKLQAVNKRMGQALTPAHFLANIVNIQYQGQNLSAEEEELAMTWVSSNHPSLMPTIINFRAKGGTIQEIYMFAEDILRKVTPVNWWKSLKRLDLETVQVMISLLTAVASSAGVERIFSSFGLIHSKLRNRLGPNKAGKIVFLFQIMNRNKEEDEDDE